MKKGNVMVALAMITALSLTFGLYQNIEQISLKS